MEGMAPNQNGNLEDTGSFDSIEAVSRIEPGIDSEPIVYGLDFNEADYQAGKDRKSTILIVLSGIVAAASIIGGLLIAQPFGGRKASEQQSAAIEQESTDEDAEADDQTQEEGEDGEEASVVEDTTPAPFVLPDQPSLDDLAQQIRQLTFDGNDVSLANSNIIVEARGGRVQVTHVLAEGNAPEPNAVAGNAALRAAALVNAIGSRPVRGADEEAATAFTDLTWIVRNSAGDSYLAVCYYANSAPTSGDGFSVLAQSPRYRLSDSLYSALGGAVQQEMGETPTLITGEYIWSTAVI